MTQKPIFQRIFLMPLISKHNLTKLVIWRLTIALIVVLTISWIFLYATRPVATGSGDNVTGFAWSENFGWISFNSTDCDIDGDGIFEGAGETGGPAPAGCPTAGTVFDYGVNIDPATKNFSGYAWSEYLGWINFQEAGAPPDNYAFNSNCLDTCDSSNNCTACYNSTNGNVYGWGKVLSLGDDGWIKMSDDSVPVWNGKGVKIDSATGDFSGWAWNGNATVGTGVGWISFNCLNDSSCGVSNYKVHVSLDLNNPPTVAPDSMTDPGNWSYTNACGSFGALQAQLSWIYSDIDGDPQTSYQIIFDELDHTPAELDTLLDGTGIYLPLVTTELSGETNSFFPTQNNPYGRAVALLYDTPYYWWVKVWDDKDASSGWVQFNDLTNADGDGNAKTFTTYKHEFPDVDFTWFPASPSVGEEALFADNSTAYGGSSKTGWSWTAPNATITSPAEANTIITFNAAGLQDVTLEVTDSDGYYCNGTKAVGINVTLPKWKEVQP